MLHVWWIFSLFLHFIRKLSFYHVLSCWKFVMDEIPFFHLSFSFLMLLVLCTLLLFLDLLWKMLDSASFCPVKVLYPSRSLEKELIHMFNVQRKSFRNKIWLKCFYYLGTISIGCKDTGQYPKVKFWFANLTLLLWHSRILQNGIM